MGDCCLDCTFLPVLSFGSLPLSFDELTKEGLSYLTSDCKGSDMLLGCPDFLGLTVLTISAASRSCSQFCKAFTGKFLVEKHATKLHDMFSANPG